MGIANASRARSATRLAACVVACVCAVSLLASSALGDAFEERRISIGTKLLRQLLAANLGFVGRDEGLTVWIVQHRHGSASRLSRHAIAQLEGTKVRNLDLKLEVHGLNEIGDALEAPQAILLAEPMSANEVRQLAAFAAELGIVVFSPFEGDVDRGILAGFEVGAQVQHLLNRNSLERSGIQLKDFYLKTAKMR